ncbi:MAG: hypothetical protein L6R39_003652 [Caloplaca ligustica]|nr:MAG: hypothetical protein L6R39_003652 [Caloplaca ligustica]
MIADEIFTNSLLYPPFVVLNLLHPDLEARCIRFATLLQPMAHAGSDPNASLQGLFASLRPGGSRTSSTSHSPQLADENSAQNIRQSRPFFRPATAASRSPRPQPPDLPSTFSPSPTTANSRSFSQNPAMSKPPASAGDPASTDRTANLLNLLKFGTSNAASQGATQQPQATRPGHGGQDTHSVHGRGISASDLVGSLMGKPASPLPREGVKPPPSINHQDTLLKLLNRSASSQLENPRQSPNLATSQDEEAVHGLSQGLSKTQLDQHSSQAENESRSVRKDSPIRYFGTAEARPTPFEPQDLPHSGPTPKKEPLFTYVNPFEQLAASSPVNAKASTPTAEGHKRKSKRLTPEPTTSRRKITPAGDEVLQSIESPQPIPRKDGRSQVEKLMGIGAPTKDAETVAEALNEVGSKVDQEAGKALAKAEAKVDEVEKAADTNNGESREALEAELGALEEAVHATATEVKHELDKDENKGILEEAMSAPVAEAVKDIIDDAAEAWESDDREEAQVQAEDDHVVRVYQFPLRPFVSIDIKRKSPATLQVRDDALTHIARFKKDFDQIDRTLATATNEFIAYGSPTRGGLTLLRQDDGKAKHLFTDAQDRIFHVSLSTTPKPQEGFQTVLAAGVSGAVYWATIMKGDGDFFDHGLHQGGLVIPPTASQPENVSGGQLKTRAKKSSRHPEFFAIGRGKAIHIIFPQHAASSEHLLGGDRVGTGITLDTENYLKERNLKIATGKAGKDFAFSEDDSVIVSLDKVGRLAFWDVVDLLDSANGSASKIAPIELKSPVLSFATASTSEKSWPTSIMLLDKARSYVKGIAQRYALVGVKQNHTLQLWDLCLLKAVQEVNFPHESETDAICSVAYHPPSGIVVLAHPTRNSIYFVHLSAPKYNLPSMSQARFVQRLAGKDATLPRPEATAIMSGLREYSFDSVGHIRSVDLLAMEDSRRLPDDDEDPPLFELYVMHSRGVTSLTVHKADLGWSKESKVLHPLDAEKERYISLKDLREIPHVALSEHSSVNGDPASTSAASKPSQREAIRPAQTPQKKNRNAKHEERATVETPLPQEHPDVANPTAPPNGTTEKSEKKKNKKRDAAAAAADPAAKRVEEAPAATEAHPQATQEAAQPSEPKRTTLGPSENARSTGSKPNGESISVGISGEFLDKELKKVEQAVSAEFKRVFDQELETLYRRFDDDKRVQSAAGAAKQDAMLRLVSATLGENVEKSLSRIVQTNIQQVVVPAIADTVAGTIDKRLSEIMTQQLHNAIPASLKLALPEAISRGVQNPDVLRVLSDQLSSKLSVHVDREFSAALRKTIMPAFQNLAVNLAQKVSGEADARMQEQLKRADIQHRNDSVKIDQLTDLVRGLSETVNAMATAQSQFQGEILKLQQQVVQNRRTSTGGTQSSKRASAASRESTAVPKAPEEEALETVSGLMSAGQFEVATIQWLQSEFQNYIFDAYLAGLNPGYLRELSPLLNLSVGAAVTSTLDTKLGQRLTWLDSVFSTIRPGDPELREYGARIMDVLRERLSSGFMHISMTNPGEPALREIPRLAEKASALHASFR